MVTYRTWVFLAIVALTHSPSHGKPPSSEQLKEFFLPPELSSPALSPDGDYLGCIVRSGDDFGVGVYSFATRKFNIVGGDKDSQVTAFLWKGPRRLILQLTNRKRDSSGLMAVDIDGQNPVDLWRLESIPGLVIDGLPMDPQHVLKQNASELLLVDIKDGGTKQLDGDLGGGVFRLLADNTHRFRAAYMRDSDGNQTVKWKGPGSAGDQWHKTSFKSEEHGFHPFGFDEDSRYLWVWDYSQGDECVAAKLDTLNGERTVVGQQRGFDVTHALLFGRYHEPIAIVYSQKKPILIVPLSKKYAVSVSNLQNRFDGFFPTIVDCLADKRTWIVWAGNSRLPGAYFLFDSQTNQSSLIGLTHSSQLGEDRLVSAEQIMFKGRGGHELRGLIWRPVGVKQPPLLVICPDSMPGNPAMDLFDADVQALAAHGIAVAKIDARGTFGYGETHLAAADGYVTNILREDFEDFVRTVGTMGYINEHHVGVFGEGLGGALALKIAATSDLFSTAVNINAPAKITRAALLNFSKELSTERTFTQLGGWTRSGKLAQELSPIEVGPSLKKPTLHLYNLEHLSKNKLNEDGRAMKHALEKTGVPAQVGTAYGWGEYARLPSEVAQDRANQITQIVKFIERTWPSG